MSKSRLALFVFLCGVVGVAVPKTTFAAGPVNCWEPILGQSMLCTPAPATQAHFAHLVRSGTQESAFGEAFTVPFDGSITGVRLTVQRDSATRKDLLVELHRVDVTGNQPVIHPAFATTRLPWALINTAKPTDRTVVFGQASTQQGELILMLVRVDGAVSGGNGYWLAGYQPTDIDAQPSVYSVALAGPPGQLSLVGVNPQHMRFAIYEFPKRPRDVCLACSSSAICNPIRLLTPIAPVCSCPTGYTGDGFHCGINALVEALPNSRNHNNSSWWGYNGSKVVRRGNRVVTTYVDNDVAPGTPLRLVMLQKIGNGAWQTGAVLPTSRPANIVVDPSGAIHAFVFEAYDMVVNDSWGYLKHYTFATPGDITNYTVETVVNNNGSMETVNIRVGAAVGADGTLYAGWGINLWNTGDMQSEVLYERAPNSTTWTYSLAGSQLGHDFYYPYVLPLTTGVAMVPVQDDFIPGNPPDNAYQITKYFARTNGVWSNTTLLDLTSLPIAQTQLHLLEVLDAYQASNGSVHILTAENLGPSIIRHDVLTNGVWSSSTFDTPDGFCRFARFFEVGSRLFTACSANGSVYLRPVGGTRSAEIMFPVPVENGYLYLTPPRGGTLMSETDLDVVVISGDSDSYPNGPAYYARLPKSVLSSL